MRRYKFLLVSLAILMLGCALPLNADEAKFDKRLIGSWVSDREKTIQHMRFKEGSAIEKRAKIAELFGKLKIEYTETTMKTEYEGNVEIGPYKIVASDKDSVVILGKDFEGPKLIQIHFDGDSYYVLSGYIIEFFTRIKANPPAKNP